VVKDEIGELSRSFDKMTANLKKSTASVDDLNKEISELKRMEKQLIKSLKEKEALLKEIHHRAKNNMQVISSLINLQARLIKDEKMLGFLRDNQNRLKSMAVIHEKLYQSLDMSSINFNEYLKAVTVDLFQVYSVSENKIHLKMDVEDILLGIEPAIPCGLIINELVSNALKYAFPGGREGEICIKLRSIDNGSIKLTVSDNGIGIYDTLDFEVPGSLGLQLVKMLAEDQFSGKVKLDRSHGTKFQIRFGVQGNEKNTGINC
jgi:two-component sensor histidine kinase